MPRVHNVKNSRKDQGGCSRCGKALTKGSPYRWWKFRHGGKRKRCADVACSPRSSDLTNSPKLSATYAAREAIEDAIAAWGGLDVDELREQVNAAVESIREIAEGYRESAEAIREHFETSDTADECEEKADSLDGWADELESATSNFDAFDEDNPGDGTTEEERQTAWADEVHAAIESANECPL